MNYRHAFHAGNFADVVKHIVLTRILTYLHDKPAAFRVIDTHAGAGRYDLGSDEARRGGEWQDGIAKLRVAVLPDKAAGLIAPYLDIVGAFNPGPELAAYPGSPLIARALLRPQDRMTACELEPKAHRQLIASLRHDPQARVVDLDGWTALTAFVPPKERRGMVLIDPPFEQPDEFERLAMSVAAAFVKWPTGTYMLWYPIKDLRAAAQLGTRVAGAIAAHAAIDGKADRRELREKCLRIEFYSAATQRTDTGLTGAGLVIVNPPWTLEAELKIIMPALAAVLGRDGAGQFKLDRPSP